METGLKPNSAGIPYTLVLRIEAIGFPTFGLLLYLPMIRGTASRKGSTVTERPPKAQPMAQTP